MTGSEFLARRRILAAHMEELVELAELIGDARSDPNYAGYMLQVNTAAIEDELKRVGMRLVAVQMTIEELGAEE